MENKKENKKIIVPTIIAVITLVMLTIGATYAYFTVSATNSFGTKTITATTPAIGSVALTSETNLTMNVTASQMMAGSSDITYYASSNGTTTTETTATIGTAKVTGEGTFSCDYTLTIDDNSSSLYDAFQSMSTKSEGQIVLTVNGVEYDFNTSNLFPKTISGTMNGLTSSKSQDITAQLKLVNKKSINQSALADKTLTLSFNVTNFKCNATEDVATQSGIEYVLATASSSDIWNSTLEDDGIRFVGTNPDNYICFGYDDAETDCDFTNSTNTDLYAYRIIGIFEDESGEQHLKLIKKEALNTNYEWHGDYEDDVNWEDSDLYNGLNNDYFLDNPAYSYMQNSTWLNKIETWNYTATNTKSETSDGPHYEYQSVTHTYLHEMNRNIKNDYDCTTYDFGGGMGEIEVSCNEGEWKTLSGKISLMYVSDYLLSLGSDALNYKPINNRSILKTGWMHLSNNDSEASNSSEWTMTRYSLSSDDGVYSAWQSSSNGDLNWSNVSMYCFSRPVFYLTTDVTISGEGTTTNPFIVS